jgi:peptidoglycan/xylan/chitin deacetylase (PgdA/CDA1 family)
MAPSSLVASGATESTIQLTWTKATDNVGVREYDIYRVGVSKKLGSTSASLSYTVSGLRPGTSYSFYVKARDAAKNVSPSSPVAQMSTVSTYAPPNWSSCPGGYVALTYDDGPNDGTAALLAEFKKYGVRVTYFDVGDHMAARPVLTRLQYDGGGNSVQNHTWDHQSLTGESTGTPPLTDAQIRSEFTRTTDVITATGLPAPTQFRPPYGATNDGVRSAAAPLLEIGWTNDTNDWQGPSARVVADRVLAAPSGGIVLMHDGRANTTEALQPIVVGLLAQGRCPGRIVPSTTPHTVWPGWVYNAVGAAW